MEQSRARTFYFPRAPKSIRELVRSGHPFRKLLSKLTELKNVFVFHAISCTSYSSGDPYICLAIRKTAKEVSWPVCRRLTRERTARRAFSRSVACSKPLDGITMETDVPIPLFPEIFPHEATPLLRPCPASLIPNFRPFHPLRRSSDWARSHLPPGRSFKKPTRIFVWCPSATTLSLLVFCNSSDFVFSRSHGKFNLYFSI